MARIPADGAVAGPVVPKAATGLPLRLTRLALRGTAYLGALALMAMALVWTVDRLTGESATVVALLPTVASPELADQAAELDLELMQQLMQSDRIRVLSPSAIESRPANPFPFFSYEFGARWLIETDLRKVGGDVSVTLTVADARTGIAEMRVTDRLSLPIGVSGTATPELFHALSRYMDSELGE
jgi:hypothetical protein